MDKNILDYGRPETPANRGGTISGWVSLVCSASLIPVGLTAPDAILAVLIIAVLCGVHAIVESRGRFVPGWIGLGLALLFVGWAYFLLRWN